VDRNGSNLAAPEQATLRLEAIKPAAGVAAALGAAMTLCSRLIWASDSLRRGLDGPGHQRPYSQTSTESSWAPAWMRPSSHHGGPSAAPGSSRPGH